MFGEPDASLPPESGVGALFVTARWGATRQESTQTLCIVSLPELLHAQVEACSRGLRHGIGSVSIASLQSFLLTRSADGCVRLWRSRCWTCVRIFACAREDPAAPACPFLSTAMTEKCALPHLCPLSVAALDYLMETKCSDTPRLCNGCSCGSRSTACYVVPLLEAAGLTSNCRHSDDYQISNTKYRS